MMLYMTYWFPAGDAGALHRAVPGGGAAANVIGAPMSGWLLGFEGHGLHGWQWMLLLEGIPSLLLGIAVLWLLPDRPAKAKWLSAEEKQIIAGAAGAPSRRARCTASGRCWPTGASGF